MMLHADNSRDEKARHLITLWLMHSRMRGEREVERERRRGERDRESWYFEPSQPQRIISGLEQCSICLLFFTQHASHRKRERERGREKEVMMAMTVEVFSMEQILMQSNVYV